jgi:hypothetical protein
MSTLAGYSTLSDSTGSRFGDGAGSVLRAHSCHCDTVQSICGEPIGAEETWVREDTGGERRFGATPVVKEEAGRKRMLDGCGGGRSGNGGAPIAADDNRTGECMIDPLAGILARRGDVISPTGTNDAAAGVAVLDRPLVV